MSNSTVPELTTELGTLRFDNRFTAELPADPVEGPGTRQVPAAAYSRVNPAPTSNPRLIGWSEELAVELGLSGDVELWGSTEAAEVFTGNVLLPGSDPHAANYGGHQFGNWAGQLGDGRAISLGEVIDASGHRQTLQLKGAGPTPYSRRADGLAVLRSSIREFLCSEAMHHLGVPTTRALTLASTGDEVVRDMFYDGNPKPEPGAIVCRVAPSFIRFGTFQLPASRGDLDLLKLLADFTIGHYFHHLGPPSPEVYLQWFTEVCQASCAMVVEWMRVGFVHGVMNTDNMSIHSQTIDYGPYGWLDDYDPDWTPNTTDFGQRRYRFGLQPQVTQWNLMQLANAIYPLIEDAAPLEAALTDFGTDYEDRYRTMMLAKLGLEPSPEPATDDALITDLTDVLQFVETDMTIFFRRLADLTSLTEDPLSPELLGAAYYNLAGMTADQLGRIEGWLGTYRQRVGADGRRHEDRREAMNSVNPVYVLRNYLAQQAIDAAEAGDVSGVGEIAEVLRCPYEQQPGAERYEAKRPDWARDRAGCSTLSCSS